jgi:hypothetical protein
LQQGDQVDLRPAFDGVVKCNACMGPLRDYG